MAYVKLNVLGRSVLPIEGAIVDSEGFATTGSIEGRPIYRSLGEPNINRILEAFSLPGDNVDLIYMDSQTVRLLGRETSIGDRTVNFIESRK